MDEITVGEAVTLVEAGAMLLDVREPEEWVAGHAPQATWIPMGSVAERSGELPSTRVIVVMCRAGHRSAQVTEGLTGAGFDAVNLAGGIHAWVDASQPIVTPEGLPGTVV